MLILHNYFRSSTSTRLRCALNLKDLSYSYRGYALLKGEARTETFLTLNPAGLVPVLETEDGTILRQSLAIIEYIDEIYPTPPLLPLDPLGRARVRALAYMIACDLHPLNNLRVLKYISEEHDQSGEGVAEWFHHWVGQTFPALEQQLASDSETGTFCHGDSPGLADCCLYAQVWNNRRFEIGLKEYPTIARIFDALDALPEFHRAAPPNQPDAF